MKSSNDAERILELIQAIDEMARSMNAGFVVEPWKLMALFRAMERQK
jgi:hypothetical protein